MQLNQKRIIITGASSGIGKYLALKLAGYNTNLVLVSRDHVKLDKVAAEILNKYPSNSPPLCIKCDVSNAYNVNDTINKVVEKMGGIDILINNAGIGVYGPLKNTIPPDYKKVMNTNFHGAVNFTYSALPHLLKNKKSSVVFISSVASIYGIPCYSAYAASKAALRSFSQTLRAEHGNSGILVLHVAPDYTKTKFFDNEKIVSGAKFHRDKMQPVEHVVNKIVKQIILERKETVLSLRGKLLQIATRISPHITEFYFKNRASKLLSK